MQKELPAVRISHLDWKLTVDFEAQALRATATYTLAFASADAAASRSTLQQQPQNQHQQLILDTNHLLIEKIYHAEDETRPLAYELRPETKGKPHLGRQLVIPLLSSSAASDSTTTGALPQVTVAYATTAKSSALQWLTPSQTAGRVHPYLFSQCQAIHARSLVPCQDVTGVKFTYKATVTVPAWATAVLSAVPSQSGVQQRTTVGGDKVAVWEQKVPL